MEEFENIATYLIVKRITTSQSMIRWLPTVALAVKEAEYSPEWLRSFISIIRELEDSRVLSGELIQYLLQYSLWRDEACSLVAELKKQDIKIVLWNGELYPNRLKQIEDKPAILYIFGNQTLLQVEKLVTIVGTRYPTSHGIEKCCQYVFESLHCGFTTVSGLATGIDTCVWHKSLEFGGKTIAVVPQLTSSLVAKNKEMQEHVLLVSEFPPQLEGITKWHYIARNRLLAALSAYTIVVEAPIRSGTLHTADFATMYNRELYISLPGPISPEIYGGVMFAQSLLPGVYMQSFYDILFQNTELSPAVYHDFVFKLSGGKVDIVDGEEIYLGTFNLKRHLFDACKHDLELFQKTVVELVRFGIVSERKETILFNFSGFNKWPKISL